jgi:hypothetical protein
MIDELLGELRASITRTKIKAFKEMSRTGYKRQYNSIQSRHLNNKFDIMNDMKSNIALEWKVFIPLIAPLPNFTRSGDLLNQPNLQKIQKILNDNCGKVFSNIFNSLFEKEEDFSSYSIEQLERLRGSWTGSYGLKKAIAEEFWLWTDSIHSRDNYVCAICGRKNTIEDPINVDHIIPKSKFPSSHPWNLQSTCEDCNIEKSNQLLDAIPIFLEGAKYRSKKFFSNWQCKILKNTLNYYYDIDIKYSSIFSKMDTTEHYINSIIKMNRDWGGISAFVGDEESG